MGACRSAICEYIGEVIDEVRLGCSIVSCYEYSGEFLTHSCAHSSRRSSTRPQPTTAYTPRQSTAWSRTRSNSPDDGHNDARNMLR